MASSDKEKLITGTYTVPLFRVTIAGKISTHSGRGRPSSRDISLPAFGMNEPVISVQAQPFLYWLAAPVLLPGGWLQQLSFGFPCRRATGAMEFVATMHVVCCFTGHVVVSPLPVPEIHCGLLFCLYFPILCAKQKYSTQQDGSESGMLRLKIKDKKGSGLNPCTGRSESYALVWDMCPQSAKVTSSSVNCIV